MRKLSADFSLFSVDAASFWRAGAAFAPVFLQGNHRVDTQPVLSCIIKVTEESADQNPVVLIVHLYMTQCKAHPAAIDQPFCDPSPKLKLAKEHTFLSPTCKHAEVSN